MLCSGTRFSCLFCVFPQLKGMVIIMIKGTSMSEYYFEYALEQVAVNGNADVSGIEAPNLYFERNYHKKNLPYTLSVVPKEWLETQNTQVHSLRYDSIRIIYDIGGIDYKPLLDPSSQEYKRATNKISHHNEFYENGASIIINDTSLEHSGAGVIEMLKNQQIIARFVFVINCIHRKKISYSIERRGGNLSISFECKSMPENLSVVLLHDPSRLPCLKEDKVNRVKEFNIDFRKPENYKLDNYSGHVFSLAFANDNFNKYYQLYCKRNDTLPSAEAYSALPEMTERSCPYCHQNINITDNARYKKGGISCNEFNRRGVPLPVIYSSLNSKIKNCLYCVNDLVPYDPQTPDNENTGRFRESFRRLLPSNFMSHQAFKIAFVGSTRAGKTTYISRFFGITGDERNLSMPMTMTANAMRTFGLDVNTTIMSKLEALVSETKEIRYKVTESNWVGENNEYTNRRITLDPHYFPGPTTHGNYKNLPFIAEVDNKAYVSFYDVAGEDAEGSTQINEIANDNPIGVFLIVNGKPDRDGTADVTSMLINADRLPNNSPIAVIVTKMDSFNKSFDASCHCLNTEYFYKLKGYDRSALEREINHSSEEIKSYLTQKGVLPNLGERYTNVKYFGISSFNFGDSIYTPDKDLDSVGKLLFECSSKHLELPFVWMMKQFGLI